MSDYIERYIVVQANSAKQLMEKVHKKYYEEDYEPLGGMCTTGTMFYQAMWLPEGWC